VVQVLKLAGLDVVGMVSIFSYDFSVAATAIEGAGIKYYSLTNYKSLITLAVEKGMVSASEQDILLKWRDDPASWKGVF
jgi:orotate phosphoribosyltransferase